jgi:hypothetical protein
MEDNRDMKVKRENMIIEKEKRSSKVRKIKMKDLPIGELALWTNNNKTRTNIPIVFLIEYGHAMPNGGHVPPRPFINQALEPVYDEINHDIRREAHR